MASSFFSSLVFMATVAGVSAALGSAELDNKAAQIELLLERQASLERRLEKAQASLKEGLPAAMANGPSRSLTSISADITDPLDYMWLLICGSMVMFMHAGFAVLEAGSCRTKNASTVLLKNVLTVCIGTITWYILGYGIAYGKEDDPSKAVGSRYFAGADMLPEVDGAATLTSHPKDWFFQWAFCATSSTIVSGAVAERIQLPAYMAFTAIMTGIIYPFVVYWTWSGAGFLTEEGYSDFAGSGIVHLTGGIAALVGAILCGSRANRWEKPEDFYPHNMGLVALGTFILWFGFYGFNCGSTLHMNSSAKAMEAGLVAMNTTMSGSAGGLTVFFLRFIAAKAKKQEQVYDLCGACNGILAGLVAICAGASVFEPGMALLVGIFGGLFYEAGHYLLLMLKVDDPLDAFSVHGMGGIAGLLLRPLLCLGGADGEMFGANVLGMFVIIAWSGTLALCIFLPMRLLKILSYGLQEQEAGSDVHCSPPKAYSLDATGEAVTDVKIP